MVFSGVFIPYEIKPKLRSRSGSQLKWQWHILIAKIRATSNKGAGESGSAEFKN